MYILVNKSVKTFLMIKATKLAKTQQFCQQRLNRSIWHQGSYSHFPIR